MSVYAHRCVFVPIRVHVCPCEGRRSTLSVVSWVPCALFFQTWSLIVWGSPGRLGWPAGEPQGASYFCLPITGFTGGATTPCFSVWVWALNCVPSVVRSPCPGSHLPAPPHSHFRWLRGERRRQRSRVHACIFLAFLPAAGWSIAQRIQARLVCQHCRRYINKAPSFPSDTGPGSFP